LLAFLCLFDALGYHFCDLHVCSLFLFYFCVLLCGHLNGRFLPIWFKYVIWLRNIMLFGFWMFERTSIIKNKKNKTWSRQTHNYFFLV